MKFEKVRELLTNFDRKLYAISNEKEFINEVCVLHDTIELFENAQMELLENYFMLSKDKYEDYKKIILKSVKKRLYKCGESIIVKSEIINLQDYDDIFFSLANYAINTHDDIKIYIEENGLTKNVKHCLEEIALTCLDYIDCLNNEPELPYDDYNLFKEKNVNKKVDTKSKGYTIKERFAFMNELNMFKGDFTKFTTDEKERILSIILNCNKDYARDLLTYNANGYSDDKKLGIAKHSIKRVKDELKK